MILLEDRVADWWDNQELEVKEIITRKMMAATNKRSPYPSEVEFFEPLYTNWIYNVRKSKDRLRPYVLKELGESEAETQKTREVT
jgi:hypothetical protein